MSLLRAPSTRITPQSFSGGSLFWDVDRVVRFSRSLAPGCNRHSARAMRRSLTSPRRSLPASATSLMTRPTTAVLKVISGQVETPGGSQNQGHQRSLTGPRSNATRNGGS